MKKDVFSTWLRELCSLVFLQTLQAFLFAIMIIIIAKTAVASIDENNTAVALNASGVIAIVALTSISKLEELMKKVFGLDSSVTDTSMRGGMKSFATGMVAAKMAGRVLNNGKKIGTGIKGVADSAKEKQDLNSKYLKQIDRINNRPQNPQFAAGVVGAAGAAGADSINKGNTATQTNSVVNNVADSTKTAKNNNNQTREDKKAAQTKYQQDLAAYNKKNQMEDFKDKYNSELKAIKKKRNDSIAEGVTGVAETIGAIGGGATGFVTGLSSGDIGTAIKSGGVGIGVGDYIGSKSVSLPRGANKSINQAIERIETREQRKADQKRLDAILKDIDNM